MNEEIKWIEFKEKYLVSNSGLVKSKRTQNILKPWKTHSGYYYVNLGKDYRNAIHRIVMFAWVGESRLHVNHLNGVKTDNRLCNLEYVTVSQNGIHAFKTGLNHKGEKHGQSKLTNEDVVKIKLMIKDGAGDTAISRVFLVNRKTISAIRNGKTWTQVKLD